MTLKTNLNSAPYYDDFDPSDNFQRVLFRPGYAIQARELTQLQSILQDQIEKHGSHIFKDGAIVVPGQVSFNNQYVSVRLKPTFGGDGESIDPAQYFNSTDLVMVTGETSGITAEVIGYSRAGEDAAEALLYLRYISTGTSGSAGLDEEDSSVFFEDGENLSADVGVTHTTTYDAGSNSLTVFSPDDPIDSATSIGSAVSVSAGVFYVKGTFVETTAQTFVISYNNPFPSILVGWKINEGIITPEADTTLLDNATGTSNYAAKGAHRLKITLTLASKTIDDSTDDADFSELIRIIDGDVITKAKDTIYNLLGDALAKRTFEESGNYVVEPYRIDVTESVDNFTGSTLNLGAYTAGEKTDEHLNAQDDFLTVHINPGISYINGYRYETVGTTRKDLLKARNVLTVGAETSAERAGVDFEIGNYLRLTNVYGTPDIGDVSDETTPFRSILLMDTPQATRGTVPSANGIGILRARAFQQESSGALGAGATSTNADSTYRLYAFDVRTFTRLLLTDTPSPTALANFATGGVRVTGVTSGATGFVYSDTTTFPDTTFEGTTNPVFPTIYLTNRIGEFEIGEKLYLSDSGEADLILESSDNVDLTLIDIQNYKLSDARILMMQDPDPTSSAAQDFVADIIVDDLDPADQSFFADQTTVADGAIGIRFEDGLEGGTGRLQLEKLKGARLQEPEKLQSIFKMPKSSIATLLTDDNSNISKTELNFRKQFVGTTSAAGAVSFTAGSGETFVSFVEKDYTMSILTAGDGTGSQGDIVSVSGNIAGPGTSSITITDSTVLGASAKVKMLATVTKSAVTSTPKTTNLSKQLKVLASDADGAYGVRATDKEISLGRTDVYRIQAVYDSQDTSTDAVAPTLTISDTSGTFERGERITGNASGARGRLITTSSPMSFTQTFGEGSTPFQDGETITGEFSDAIATIDTDGITTGDLVITDSFKFDDGQRNNYYDIARLVRKPNAATPTGRVLVIYDYFSHGSGNFFSVDSYNSVSGQMDYDDIPVFIATTTDPDDPAPASTFPLVDSLDFRPTVENIVGTSETLTAVDQVTGNSFDAASRQYDGTGAVVVDTPQPDSKITLDFEFYLPKIVSVYITDDGQFEILEGEPNENLIPPAPLTNAMKLADLVLPAYTFSPDEVDINYVDNRRYTMEDIGNLEERIDNLEYYTSLTMLESQTNTLEILDTNGLPRFKSGFVVDPFTGHSVGDEQNPDYECAIDPDGRELRPTTVDKSVDLALLLTNAAEQKAAGFQQTGDLVTLPYTEQNIINNAFYMDSTFVGGDSTTGLPIEPIADSPTYVGTFIKLYPDEDTWYETETNYLPKVTNTTGYDKARKNNGGQITKLSYGTGWKNVATNPGRPRSGNGGAAFGQINSRSGQDFWLYTWTYRQKQARTTTVKKLSHTWNQTKSSKRTIVPILYCRPKTLRFKVTGLKPNTKHHVFFNNTAVNKYSGPLQPSCTFNGPGYGRAASQSTSFTSVRTSDVSQGVSQRELDFPNIKISPAFPSPNQGLQLKTDDTGQLVGFFMIPDHRGSNKQDVPKFPTGARELLVTSNTKNEKGIVFSFAKDVYTAIGEMRTTTTQVTSTKVPKITTTTSSESRTIAARAYAFGGANFANLMASNKWRYYTGGNSTKVNLAIAQYIKDGVLVRSGNYLRTTAKYQTLSPGQYNRDTIGTTGFPIVDQSALYQTFHIERATGFFATSIYLYFQTKAKNDPVTISIVTTKEGRPQLIELPYSAVTLNPDEVNADEKGETFTKLTFPSPVYLKGGEKYAIRIKSKGDMYKVKTGAETTGERKNPMVGEMFLPYAQGPQGSGPTVESSATHTSHMRFVMQCAIFDTNEAGGKVTMRNEPTGELMTLENGESAYAKRLIERNPIELTNSITKVKVTHFDHGMYSTSNNVQISGVKSGVTTTLNGSITALGTKLVLKSFAGFSSGSTHADPNGVGGGAIHVKIDNELFSGSLSGNTLTVTGRGYTGYGTTSAVSTPHSDGATVELYMLYNTPLNQINKIHTAIADIEMNSYTVSITTAPIVTGSSTTIRAGGTEVFASENVRYDLFKTSIPSLELTGTAISAKVRQTTGTSPNGSETSFTTTTKAKALPIAINQEYALQNTAIIASPSNETNEMNSLRSLFFDLILTTDSIFLSPVIDLTSPAVICIANRLDNVDSSSDVYPTTNYRAHTEPVGDSNTTSYITKPVQLENTATGIKLFLDVHKPATSEVKAMYRVLPAEGEDDIKNIAFTFFNAGASKGGSVATNGLPDSGVATNAQDITDFVEYKYTAGMNDFGFGDQLQDFQQFQIKLVMQGTNAATPPRIMNLRAIALAT